MNPVNRNTKDPTRQVKELIDQFDVSLQSFDELAQTMKANGYPEIALILYGARAYISQNSRELSTVIDDVKAISSQKGLRSKVRYNRWIRYAERHPDSKIRRMIRQER